MVTIVRLQGVMIARHNNEPNVVRCDDCRDAARHVSTHETRETRETWDSVKSYKMCDIANKRRL